MEGNTWCKLLIMNNLYSYLEQHQRVQIAF